MSSSIHTLHPFPASLGYNGERHEPDTRWQLLGAGYRAYNPELRRFHSVDALSPFGAGGVNAYAYADGDPANRIDPSGQSALVSLAIVGALVAAGAGAGMALVKDDSARIALGVVFAAGTFVAITAGAKEWRQGSDERKRNRFQEQLRKTAKHDPAAAKASPSGKKLLDRSAQSSSNRKGKATRESADPKNKRRSEHLVQARNDLVRGAGRPLPFRQNQDDDFADWGRKPHLV